MWRVFCRDMLSYIRVIQVKARVKDASAMVSSMGLQVLASACFSPLSALCAPARSSTTRYNALLQLLGDMMDKCGHAFRLQVAKKILPRLQVHPSCNHQNSRVGLHPNALALCPLSAADTSARLDPAHQRARALPDSGMGRHARSHSRCQ